MYYVHESIILLLILRLRVKLLIFSSNSATRPLAFAEEHEWTATTDTLDLLISKGTCVRG